MFFNYTMNTLLQKPKYRKYTAIASLKISLQANSISRQLNLSRVFDFPEG